MPKSSAAHYAWSVADNQQQREGTPLVGNQIQISVGLGSQRLTAPLAQTIAIPIIAGPMTERTGFGGDKA